MTALNKFFEDMQAMNFTGISELFDFDATYDDYCKSGMFNTETHLIGREAINIYFANRLIFQTYTFVEGKVNDCNQAEMTVSIVGKPTKVSVYIPAFTNEGKIKSMVINEVK